MLVFIFLFSFFKVSGQTYTVSTFAGSSTGASGFQNGVGLNAQFNRPNGMATDLSGNLIVADNANHSIRRISPSGTVSTIAGNGIVGSVNGPGITATFNNPTDVAVDRNGNIYVADAENHKIRKITPTGLTTTLAGSGFSGYRDGTPDSAQFNDPISITCDNDLNVYVLEASRIRKITPNGVVSTLAGSGVAGDSDGIGVNASFRFGRSLKFVNNSGYFILITNGDRKIRRVTLEGEVNTINNFSAGFQDGPISNAFIGGFIAQAITQNGNFVFIDGLNNRVRRISSDNFVSTLAGNGTVGNTDGNGSIATFNQPSGIAVSSTGLIYISDAGNNNIRLLTPSCLTPPTPTLSAGSALTFCQGGSVILFTNNP
ncbi:MAG: hypothetical protein ACOVMN_04985, partial [Flexibacteraceae bacterium]